MLICGSPFFIAQKSIQQREIISVDDLIFGIVPKDLVEFIGAFTGNFPAFGGRDVGKTGISDGDDRVFPGVAVRHKKPFPKYT